MKVDIDVNYMEYLLKKAEESGTLENWASIAIDWMKKASMEVDKLTEELLKTHKD